MSASKDSYYYSYNSLGTASDSIAHTPTYYLFEGGYIVPTDTNDTTFNSEGYAYIYIKDEDTTIIKEDNGDSVTYYTTYEVTTIEGTSYSLATIANNWDDYKDKEIVKTTDNIAVYVKDQYWVDTNKHVYKRSEYTVAGEDDSSGFNGFLVKSVTSYAGASNSNFNYNKYYNANMNLYTRYKYSTSLANVSAWGGYAEALTNNRDGSIYFVESVKVTLGGGKCLQWYNGSTQVSESSVKSGTITIS